MTRYFKDLEHLVQSQLNDCPRHSGKSNEEARRSMDAIMDQLPWNQSGAGRHKCPYCAYEQGLKDIDKIKRQDGNNNIGNNQGLGVSHELNTIFYGPPGTGKTYRTMSRSIFICDGEEPSDDEIPVRYAELVKDGRIKFITFHQSYGYEEFVEGIRPEIINEQVHFKVQDGILKDIVKSIDSSSLGENSNSELNYVLIIDEINRANISKVLGELITLLEEDKRRGAENELTVTLPYSKNEFTLPRNLFIVGTMNTADRSIALLDTALRRRFYFENVSPDPQLLNEAKQRTDVDLPTLLIKLNEQLEIMVGRDHLIGHAWLMNVKDRNHLDNVMRNKIIPLITEYFYEDWNKVWLILGKEFIEKRKLELRAAVKKEEEYDDIQYSIKDSISPDAYYNFINMS